MMNYGRKTPSTYRSNPSVYSHATGRSSTNLHSKMSRSTRSVRIPWYQRPLLKNNQYIDIQKGAMLVGLFAIFLSLFTIATSIFDIYCYAMAAPGSTHYGYYIISYEFVYVGNKHVRNMLIVFALFSLIMALINFVTSVLLCVALRKEYERKVMPWLWSFAIFTVWRALALIFFAIVNDLYFAYNVIMVLLWTIFCVLSIYGWAVVYSLFLELVDLTKLEDLAHLRMGTMASLHASTANSLAGSRPTTPHSTVSTMPVG
uniref:LD42595p n=1 Tax=Drosophila melanogaster TaxID=7227 RepID=Q9VHF5_DROME|eukprot:NP_649883.1 pasiflora 2, isoform A [Drosophila melanogaster]